MSGGHWDYLSIKLEERIAMPLDDVWRLLAAIEHELDYGICCDTCYTCAKIRTINALEAYFDTRATSVELSLRLIRSREPECEKCKAYRKQGHAPPLPRPPDSVSIRFDFEGKTYKGVAYEVSERKE